MLPDDRPSGPLRRALQYFGLSNETDARFRQREHRPQPARAPEGEAARAESTGESSSEPGSRRDSAARGLRTLAVYFGLAEDPDGLPSGRSRYGQTSTRLDRDIDELRARVAELEARVGERSSPPPGRPQ